MYLFRDQEEVKVPITCKICLKEIKFSITSREYKTSSFPIKRESIHGTPEHKLTVYINKNLEVENFKLEDVLVEEEEAIPYDEEITRQVLSNIDLSDEEIELYFTITGRDAVSLGEIALLIDKPTEVAKSMAEHFVEKGLFREIPGAKPHYTPLPPYAALVSQLSSFRSYITDLKNTAPAQLSQSFSQLESQADGIKTLKDYTDFMLDLKHNALSKMSSQKQQFDKTASVIEEISNLSDFINVLESKAKNIMDGEMSELTKQFGDIRERIARSMDRQVEDLSNQFDQVSSNISKVMKNQIDNFKNQFSHMKEKISDNIQKLRLGVLQQAVDQIIEMSFSEWLNKLTENLNNQLEAIERISKDGLVKTKISLNRQINEIQKVQNEGLEDTTKKFNQDLISKLKESIDNTVENIKGITTSTAKYGDDIKKLFGDISDSFGKAVTMAEEKLGGISENVFDSFGQLRETFSTKIINTLNEVLKNILERLELSEKATKQFWQLATRGGGAAALTMQDVWFIRSIEGAKAHVNEELSKAKMRVLIVAPQITDISLDSIKASKSHINIRIAANIDISNREHVTILEELNKLHNVSFRNRKLQNLWGINKDYEEIILCVISETEVGGVKKTEIAGIGSIIQEHIKIFVPILEDAWMGSQKDISGLVKTSFMKEQLDKFSIPEQPVQTKPSREYRPSTEKEQLVTPKETIKSRSVEEKYEPLKKPTIVPEAILKSAPQEQKPEISAQIHFPEKLEEETEKSVSAVPKKALPEQDAALAREFNILIKTIEKMTGREISLRLEIIRNQIVENRGFSGVLKPINLSINTLKFDNNKLSKTAINQLLSKMEFWKKKLNI